VPAQVKGEVDEKLRARILQGVDDYLACAAGYREGRLGGGPHGGAPPRSPRGPVPRRGS